MSYRPSVSPTGTAKVKRKTALSLNPLTVDVDEGDITLFTGKLTEASGPNVGQGVAGKTIHLMVDGADVAQAITGSDGSFSISHTWTVAGEYQYFAQYLGD